MDRKQDLSPVYLLVLISLLGIGIFIVNHKSFPSRQRAKKKTNEMIFTQIYEEMKWSDLGSVSGPGSDLMQTAIIRQEIPKLLKELGVKKLVDAPCGDFYWMKDLKLGVDEYIGVDIVDEIIIKNKRKYGNEDRRFITSDLTSQSMETGDLIICRDCFILLSFEDILKILHQFKKSGSRYLLTTSYVERSINRNVPNGEFHPINLLAGPFFFPKPLKIINENCTEESGKYKDKSLVLWDLEEIHLEQIKVSPFSF